MPKKNNQQNVNVLDINANAQEPEILEDFK